MRDLLKLDSIENNVVCGTVVSDNFDFFANELEILVNGSVEGRGVAVFPKTTTNSQMISHHGSFRIPIVDVEVERQLDVAVRLAGQDAVFAKGRFLQKPNLSKKGLSSVRVASLHKLPLIGINGFSINRGFLEITGLAIAPEGDPRRVLLDCGENVAYEFQYPLPNPDASAYYWYWPNSGFSAFRILIDFAETKSVGEDFCLSFSFTGIEETDIQQLRNKFYIPKNLETYQNFPPQQNLTRVQRFDTISGTVVRGYSDYKRLQAIAQFHGLELDNAKVLDWGCGHGRIARHFISAASNYKVFGTDIDPDNINWASKHLTGGKFSVGPLMPPTTFANSEFDLIYGISVMTHLTQEVQEAWLEELSRIVKPSGLVLLTFTGDASVAFASRELDIDWFEIYVTTGRGPDLPSTDLVGQIENPDYYKNVKVSAKQVHNLCLPYFEILAIHDDMFGYQDLAVLKRRDIN